MQCHILHDLFRSLFQDDRKIWTTFLDTGWTWTPVVPVGLVHRRHNFYCLAYWCAVSGSGKLAGSLKR